MNERDNELTPERPRRTYLSAQEYHSLTQRERDNLETELISEERDPEEYEREMKKLWPKKWTPRETVWRPR